MIARKVRQRLRRLTNRVTQADVVMSQVENVMFQLENMRGEIGNLAEKVADRIRADRMREPFQAVRPYYYLGGYRALTTLSTGAPFFVNTRDHAITTWIILGGVWETFVDEVLCALVRPGTVFLDVGANQGYYTIKVSHLLGAGGHRYRFEPNPQLYSFLEENVSINALADRVSTYRLAAGEAPGKSKLHFSYSNMGGGYIDVPGTTANGNDDGIEVEIVRIDDHIPKDRPVDLVKIDVEGFEPLAIRGMKETLSRSPESAIILEVSIEQWRRFGDPYQILNDVLGERNIYLIGHDGRLRPMSAQGTHLWLPHVPISYVLMLPKIAERERAIAGFIVSD